MKKNEIVIPADVPPAKHETFIKNYEAITRGTGNLLLFAGDQKIEHMNKDFYGEGIHPDAQNPEHLFKIADRGKIGAFATQFGLISRYCETFSNINYILKMNSKTDFIAPEEMLPRSVQMWNLGDILKVQETSGMKARGIGYTVYLGSKDEWKMLEQAGQLTNQAHQNGMVAILWMYPRGKQVHHPRDAETVAGAAGVAACLGADFVKVNPPIPRLGEKQAELLRQAVEAAGNTKVICSGGEQKKPEEFLQTVHDQIHIGGACGAAVGRNIFQRSTKDAIAMTKAISTIVFDGKDVKTAMKELKKS